MDRKNSKSKKLITLIKKKISVIKIGNNLLLISGIILIAIFSTWRYYRVRILSFNTSEVPVSNSVGVKPVHIKSYPLGVDVDIKETTIKDGVWMIPSESAAHLVTSSGINGGGNIIIYGHNKNNILGPIRWMKEGSVIDLEGDNGKSYSYKVIKVDEVSPDNLDYIKPKNEEILTVYTCSGFFDSKRFVVTAKFSPKPSNP